MHVRRIVWFGLSTLALASWFAAASTTGVRPPVIPLPPSRPAALDRSVAALQSEVARLHERLGPTIVPSRSRDLFRFSARAAERRGPAQPRPVAPAVAEAPPPIAARPVLKLIGVAEDAVPDGVVRTAVLSGLGDVFLVKAGDIVSGQYRVDQVSSDTVQITDTSTSLSTTLALR